MRLPVASVVFVSVAIYGGAWENKVFWKNTTRRRGDFSKNRRLDLVLPSRHGVLLRLRTEMHEAIW